MACMTLADPTTNTSFNPLQSTPICNPLSSTHGDHLLPRDLYTSVTVSPFRSTSYIVDPSNLSITRETSNSRPLTRRLLGLRRTNTMPAPIEITNPVNMARDLQDDEKLVVKDFERHASHCDLCFDPLKTHKAKGSLCSRGNTYANTLTTYIFSRAGKHYSSVDYESGKSTRVAVPSEALSVRSLLAAIEHGLRTRQTPVIVQPVQPVQPAPAPVSYDRTYQVIARGPTTTRPRSMSPESYQIIERSPRLSRSPNSITYRSPGGSPSRPSSSRGSLYDVDHVTRIERRVEPPRRYVEGSTRYHR
ncbi:unnamed protein product [Penicillium bialowiezense]